MGDGCALWKTLTKLVDEHFILFLSFDKAKQKSKLKRQAMKLMSGSRQSKKIMHALISRQYKKEAQKITKQCAIEREDIIKRNPSLSWLDWLQ